VAVQGARAQREPQLHAVRPCGIEPRLQAIAQLGDLGRRRLSRTERSKRSAQDVFLRDRGEERVAVGVSLHQRRLETPADRRLEARRGPGRQDQADDGRPHGEGEHEPEGGDAAAAVIVQGPAIVPSPRAPPRMG
jgi:hypothetical protein